MSCKLSPLETICTKCQILFTEENKTSISKCHLLKILTRVLIINVPFETVIKHSNIYFIYLFTFFL